MSPQSDIPAPDVGTDAQTVVQGFGNVGSNAARLMWEEGCVIIGTSDVYGGIYNEQSLDLPALVRHVAEAKTVVGFPGATPISNNDLLELPCTFLVPAPRRRRQTPFSRRGESRSSRTSWRTQAASWCRTLNGCRSILEVRHA